MDSRRGRLKKNAGDSRHESPAYWIGDVFIDQGWCWVTDFVEVYSIDNKERMEARPLCLGSEDDIVPILRGHKPIPDDIHPRRRALLESVIEEAQHGGIKTDPRATRLQRGRHARALRHRQKDLRRLKAREGLAFRKAYCQGKGLPNR